MLVTVVAYTLSQANSPSRAALVERIRNEMHQPSHYTLKIQEELHSTERYNALKRNLETELTSLSHR
jgi:hypothetical protein